MTWINQVKHFVKATGRISCPEKIQKIDVRASEHESHLYCVSNHRNTGLLTQAQSTSLTINLKKAKLTWHSCQGFYGKLSDPNWLTFTNSCMFSAVHWITVLIFRDYRSNSTFAILCFCFSKLNRKHNWLFKTFERLTVGKACVWYTHFSGCSLSLRMWETESKNIKK